MRRVIAVVAVVAVVLGVSVYFVARQRTDVEVRRDLAYKEVDGRTMLLDAYLPRRNGPHPAVMLVDGGGWIMGDKASWEPYARLLAESGFAAIAMNYRLAPGSPFPAAADDVRDATAWVREHAAELDVDPARFAAVGGSAGAQLAALLATEGTGPWDQGSRVAAAVSWAGPMDLHPADYPPEAQSYLRAFLACGPTTCNEDTVDDASPITHVDGSDPPMLLVHGAVDLLVPPNQAERMAAALDAAGVPNDLRLVAGAGHDEKLLPGVVEPTIEFLRARLGVPGL